MNRYYKLYEIKVILTILILIIFNFFTSNNVQSITVAPIFIDEASNGFDYPINYQPDNFGYRFLGEADSGAIHPGTDWNGQNDGSGDFPVYSVADGMIVAVNRTAWGGIIVIEHNYNGKTFYSQYGHVIPLEGLPNLSPDDNDFNPIPIDKGQQIAVINPHPGPWNPHLHFEIRNSYHNDPTDADYWIGGNYATGLNRWKIFLYYEEPKSFILTHGDYSNNQIQPIIVDSSSTFKDKDGVPISEFIDNNGVLTIDVDGQGNNVSKHNFFVASHLHEFNEYIPGIGENRAFGGNFHWVETTDGDEATAEGIWYFRVLKAGYYCVEVNIPKGPVNGLIPSTTENAIYEIIHNGEISYSNLVNQNEIDSDNIDERWVSIGKWYFSPNFSSCIKLSNNTGENDKYIAYDAIRVTGGKFYVDDDHTSPLHPDCTDRTGTFDDPYCTIQEGIDAAETGGIVLVADGIYCQNINFNGKVITVQSQNGPETTIIDGGQNGSVVTFTGYDNSILDGFTIRNGLT